MRRAVGFGILLLTGVAFGGCALLRESPAQRALDVAPMLSAAGFRMIPADTPAKQAALASLTPARVLFHLRDGKPAYWMADPYNCRCLYVGDEKAFQAYQQLRFQQHLADEQQAAAMANEAAAADMMMGPVWWW